jgi:YggT family protein
MIEILITLIQAIGSVLFLVVIANAVLSFFLSPFHPVRVALGTIVEPLLAPIRKVLPPLGMIDFSPIVLIILIQVLQTFLIMLLSSFR